MSTRVTFALGVAVAVAALACAGARDDPPKTPATTNLQAEIDSCPLGIRGLSMVVRDTDEGAAVAFTTLRDASELRVRIQNAANRYGAGGHLGLGHRSGEHGAGQGHGLRLDTMPVQTVDVRPVEGGARLVLGAEPPRRAELRMRLRARLEFLRTQPCDE